MTPVLGLGMIMLRWASSEGMMANRVVSMLRFMLSNLYNYRFGKSSPTPQ